MSKNNYYETIGGEIWDIRMCNPMVRAFGRGPTGTRCKECKHLFVMEYSKRYYKCGLRRFSHGAATDHRANWPVCKKFEPDTE